VITAAQVRKLALSLPEATEQDHWGNPSFRVRGKIFATMGVEEKRVTLKLAADEQEQVVAMSPDVFEAIAWGNQGWTRVAMTRADPAIFAELLTGAWKRLAPKRAIAALEGGTAPASPRAKPKAKSRAAPRRR
jgi:hypothetical protein